MLLLHNFIVTYLIHTSKIETLLQGEPLLAKVSP